MKEKIEWGILNIEEAASKKESLSEIVKLGNLEEAVKILQDQKLLRTLTLNRGEGGENFKLIQESLDLVIKEKFGPEADFFHLDGEQLIELLHEYKIPEQVLGEILSGSYHLRDKVRFFRTYSLIMENYQELSNHELVDFANHDMATWYSSVEGDRERASKLNKQVLDSAKTKDLKIITSKAKFGITANKNLKPKDRAIGFEEISQQMESIEHLYDAQRAKIEEIKALVELAGNQKDRNSQSVREENLGRSMQLSKEILEYAQNHHYANLEVLSFECQVLIAKEVGDSRRVKQFYTKLDNLKEYYEKN